MPDDLTHASLVCPLLQLLYVTFLKDLSAVEEDDDGTPDIGLLADGSVGL